MVVNIGLLSIFALSRKLVSFDKGAFHGYRAIRPEKENGKKEKKKEKRKRQKAILFFFSGAE
jgi:hypothetical protein